MVSRKGEGRSTERIQFHDKKITLYERADQTAQGIEARVFSFFSCTQLHESSFVPRTPQIGRGETPGTARCNIDEDGGIFLIFFLFL